MEEMKEMKEQTQVCKCCGKELPLAMFGVSRLGRLKTCRDCTRKHQVQAKLNKKLSKFQGDEVEKARKMRLADFTPRELMSELKRRGYEFTMKYTETHIINSKDI